MIDASKSDRHVQPHEYAEHMHEAWHCHVPLRQNVTDKIAGENERIEFFLLFPFRSKIVLIEGHRNLKSCPILVEGHLRVACTSVYKLIYIIRVTDSKLWNYVKHNCSTVRHACDPTISYMHKSAVVIQLLSTICYRN